MTQDYKDFKPAGPHPLKLVFWMLVLIVSLGATVWFRSITRPAAQPVGAVAGALVTPSLQPTDMPDARVSDPVIVAALPVPATAIPATLTNTAQPTRTEVPTRTARPTWTATLTPIPSSTPDNYLIMLAEQRNQQKLDRSLERARGWLAIYIVGSVFTALFWFAVLFVTRDIFEHWKRNRLAALEAPAPIEMSKVPGVTALEFMQIRLMYAERINGAPRYTQEEIEAAVYGYPGGGAYRKVKKVLDYLDDANSPTRALSTGV